jgi:hypothetical protein
MANWVAAPMKSQVEVGRGREGPRIISSGLAAASAQMESYQTYQLQNVPQNLISGQVRFRTAIPIPDRRSHGFALRFNITSSGACVVPPTPYWFRRIQLLRKDGEVLRTYHADSLFSELMLSVDGDRLKALCESHNMDGRESSMGGQGPPLAAGETKNFHLMLPYFFANWPGSFEGQNEEIHIEFEPTETFLVSGSSTITVNSVSAHWQVSNALYKDDRKARDSRISSVIETAVLEPIVITRPGFTITAGSSENKVPLDAFVGKAAFMGVFPRASGATNASNQLALGVRDLGVFHPNAAVDVLDGNNQSLFGNGTPLSINVLKMDNALHMTPNPFFKDRPHIFISFADQEFRKSLAGSINGILEFQPGHKNQLQIVTPGAPTNEVHTVTTVNGSASGLGSVVYKDAQVNGVDFASTGSVKIALDALPPLRAKGVTATVSGAICATGSATITYATSTANPRIAPYSDSSDLPAFIGHNSLNQSSTVAVTTAGASGCTTGTYDISVVIWKLRKATSLGGKISVTDM